MFSHRNARKLATIGSSGHFDEKSFAVALRVRQQEISCHSAPSKICLYSNDCFPRSLSDEIKQQSAFHRGDFTFAKRIQRFF